MKNVTAIGSGSGKFVLYFDTEMDLGPPFFLHKQWDFRQVLSSISFQSFL